jgi:tetratricopeptide (TPR) repeat protein
MATTRALFAKFYEQLLRGKGTGEALDNARRQLFRKQERGTRQRNERQITLKLQDWFLPALYQVGKDTALLRRDLTRQKREERSIWGNIRPLQEAGFFGRSRELWQIERWFVQGTRRITISGFGGQGKTFLVEEAGRWLCRTGMFERVCFVDYAAFQGVDAVGLAVSTLATVLKESLIDAGATSQALREQSTLLILDNLESLQPQPLRELLDVAKEWSEVEDCRVLLTTRMLDFHHPDYPTEESLRHRSLLLGGLGQEDALTYFQKLMEFPPAPQFDLPKREVLQRLFKLVDFHPLSIGLLARQLKVRCPADVGESLARLIAQTPDNPLLASLNLSLERLDDEVRQLVTRLGVFQGGAMEDVLLVVTRFSKSQWQNLRPALEATGLMQPEHLPEVAVPYLKFHPTLAPALWLDLSLEEQAELLAHHRLRYYQASRHLYFGDDKYTYQSRAIAQRELPNLLYGVKSALNTGEEWAVYFVEYVNKFLDYFGLRCDCASLLQRIEDADEKVGSPTWFIVRSNRGTNLYIEGHYQQAAQVFHEILTGLGEQPTYQHCLTLGHLARCLRQQGQAAQAAELYYRGLAGLRQLTASDSVKREMGILCNDLGEALTDIGEYDEARIAFKQSLDLKKEIGGDVRGEAVVKLRLGNLALLQENIAEAKRYYQEALTVFQQLDEPAIEADAWHQLGLAYQQAQQWEEAEQSYREAARIRDFLGNLADAASTWNNLALVMRWAGKSEDAEAWFLKAIEGGKAVRDWLRVARALTNLADLLQNEANRLPEARQLAEEALAIKQTLNPAVAKIWTTYNTLAEIADKQGDANQARDYRCLSRQAKAAFAGTQYELRKYGQLIRDSSGSCE